jgi:hypothetical protein
MVSLAINTTFLIKIPFFFYYRYILYLFSSDGGFHEKETKFRENHDSFHTNSFLQRVKKCFRPNPIQHQTSILKEIATSVKNILMV